MPVILLALLEKLVLSPVVQDEAWSLLKPHLEAGTPPSPETIAAADSAADEAYARHNAG